MSSIYNHEPQPTASLILHTTSGPISLELWASQTPLTSRNFLQHCLDGYYDSTIFHRLIPGFILQGGDPTSTGNGGDSIYDGGRYAESREEHGIWPMEERTGKNAGPQGVGFRDEFHSRLKYTRRGLLGMANEGKDSNLSQFFITLGDTPELQGRNTLFGRVAGDTIYNVAKMGEAEVEGDRPLYPTRIERVEILINPFKDMVRTERVATVVTESVKPVAKPKKRKGGKQLLSFGAEEDDGDSGPIVKKAKFDTRIAVDVEEEAKPQPKKKSEKKVVKRPISLSPSPEPITQEPIPSIPIRNEPPPSLSPSPEPQAQNEPSLLDKTNAQIAALKASMRRNVPTAPAPEKKKSALESLIPSTSIRGRKRQAAGKASAATNDAQSLAILRAFQSKLDEAPPEKEVTKDIPLDTSGTNGTTTEENDEEAALCDLHFIADCQSCKAWDVGQGEEADADDDDGNSWMSHALSFKADKLGKDLSYRKKAEEELMVIDPREKARTLKEEKRAEREARSGGRTGREWDAARNEKMARASNFAGRGAR